MLLDVGLVAVHQQRRFAVGIRDLVVAAVDAQQMPAVAEHTFVGPVGGGSAHRHHGDPVHQEHHQRKDGQPQPAVGDDAVNLVGGGQLALGLLLLIAALDELGDIDIALVGDDALGVIVQLLLGGLDVRLDVGHDGGIDLQLLQHLVIPLEDLDGVPALLLLGQIMHRRLLDVGDGVLYRPGEGVHRYGLSGGGSLHSGLRRLHHTVALQGGDLHHLAAQLAAQLLHVDLVAVLANHVHHVDGDHNGDAQLRQLGGQIEIALQIGAVDDVQNGVGALADQVVAGHHLLQRVGGQGVDAGQVHDDHVLVLFQASLLLLHRDAGPVAHKLVGAGQGVEQRCLTAVGVARQRDLDLFFHIFSPFG